MSVTKKYGTEHNKWIQYLKPRYANSKEVRERHKIAVAKWYKKKFKDKEYAKQFRIKKLAYLKAYRLKKKNVQNKTN